jgi:hypothetical protein
LFTSFHKVWDDLVLEELMLSPNRTMPTLQVFYSNNNPTLPPPALSSPMSMAAIVEDRITIEAITARPTEVMMAEVMAAVATTLPARARRAKAASTALPHLLGPPYTILGLVPSKCTPVQL